MIRISVWYYGFIGVLLLMIRNSCWLGAAGVWVCYITTTPYTRIYKPVTIQATRYQGDIVEQIENRHQLIAHLARFNASQTTIYRPFVLLLPFDHEPLYYCYVTTSVVRIKQPYLYSVNSSCLSKSSKATQRLDRQAKRQQCLQLRLKRYEYIRHGPNCAPN